MKISLTLAIAIADAESEYRCTLDIRIAMQHSSAARCRAIKAEEVGSAAEKALFDLNLKPPENFAVGKPEGRGGAEDWLENPLGYFDTLPVSEEDEAPDGWINCNLNGTDRRVPWGGYRDVMRVAHRHDIESAELSSNPAKFKRGTTIIRTRLFDLSRI